MEAVKEWTALSECKRKSERVEKIQERAKSGFQVRCRVVCSVLAAPFAVMMGREDCSSNLLHPQAGMLTVGRHFNIIGLKGAPRDRILTSSAIDCNESVKAIVLAACSLVCAGNG